MKNRKILVLLFVSIIFEIISLIVFGISYSNLNQKKDLNKANIVSSSYVTTLKKTTSEILENISTTKFVSKTTKTKKEIIL